MTSLFLTVTLCHLLQQDERSARSRTRREVPWLELPGSCSDNRPLRQTDRFFQAGTRRWILNFFLEQSCPPCKIPLFERSEASA
jgi:hypothetical protein